MTSAAKKRFRVEDIPAKGHLDKLIKQRLLELEKAIKVNDENAQRGRERAEEHQAGADRLRAERAVLLAELSDRGFDIPEEA
jgi:hypothetical protein